MKASSKHWIPTTQSQNSKHIPEEVCLQSKKKVDRNIFANEQLGQSEVLNTILKAHYCSNTKLTKCSTVKTNSRHRTGGERADSLLLLDFI